MSNRYVKQIYNGYGINGIDDNNENVGLSENYTHEISFTANKLSLLSFLAKKIWYGIFMVYSIDSSQILQTTLYSKSRRLKTLAIVIRTIKKLYWASTCWEQLWNYFIGLLTTVVFILLLLSYCILLKIRLICTLSQLPC